MRAPCRLLVAVLAAGLVATAARAADEGLVLRESAERLAATGRCQEAIEKARRARDLAPDDARAAALEGRCELYLKRYDAAVAPLETARRLDPTLPGVAVDLLMAQYHRGDFAAAERALADAEAQSPDDPRLLLYRGLLHLERAEDAQAASDLERAARADASIDPLASYYAALAWERARQREKAREALERAELGQAPWSEQARQALARLDTSAHVGLGAWWATLIGGLEWDDNVVLRGDGVSLPNPGLPSHVSNQADARGVWSAEAGAELLRSRNWAGGAIAGYDGNAHFDLGAYDLQSPNASLWLDRRLGEHSFARLQPFASYTWYDANPFLAEVGGVLSLHHEFERAGSGRLYGQYSYRDYLYSTKNLGGPPSLARQRNRDGTDFRVGYDHTLAVTDSTTLRGGILYGRYEAQGDEYSHESYGAYAGLRQALPAKFAFDAEGGYAYEPYRHPSSFFVGTPNTVKRRDSIWTVRLLLERPLTHRLTLSGYWRYTNESSNTPVFDYDRNILGGYFTLSFGS